MKKDTGSTSLTGKAYETLKDMIVRGQLAQGEVLSMVSLASQLGLSRTPLTIACQKLENDGFVRIIPKKGVIVSVLTVDDAREMYELRMAIEGFSAKKSFERITPADIDLLKKSFKKQKEFVKVHDVYNFLKEDTEFHMQILKKYDNRLFVNSFNNLRDRVFLFGLKVCSSQSRLDGCIVEHTAMIQHLENGEKNEFISALEENIMNGYIQLTGSYRLG